MKPSRLLLAVIGLPAVLSGSLSAGDLHLQDDAFYAAAAALLPSFQGVPIPLDPAESQNAGGWAPPIVFPHVPVTASNLPDGRILTYASSQRTSFPGGPEFTYGALWNPSTGTITELNWDQHDMFCGAPVLRADGRFQVMGGRNTVRLSSIFNWQTNTWNRLADMNDPRWYTTAVTLPNQEIFTMSGSGGDYSAEHFTGPAWVRYANINWSPVASQPLIEANWTPYLFLAPDGRLFHAGPTSAMNWVSTEGHGAVSPAGANYPGTWYPKDAAIVMYEPGKLLVAGGLATGTAETPTNLACKIDLYANPPTVTSLPAMATVRRFCNGIVLPTGEVLVIGGNTSGQKFSDAGSVLAAEIWNPRTGLWRTAAGMTVPRNYHSVALLLTDGRVMAGGSGLAGNAAVDHSDVEVYTPPALFNAAGQPAVQPSLTAAPSTIGATGRFTVQGTPGLLRFSMIRMSSITHGLSTDQRYFSPAFCETSPGNYELSPHNNVNVMTPGYWMLFGVDASGVPSRSRVILVSTAASVAVPGVNLALNKATQQSSVFAPAYTSNRAVDGLTNADFNVAAGVITQFEAGAWWQVDLGDVYALNAVRIFNRGEGTGSRLTDFSVHVSNFPFSDTNTDISSYRYLSTAGPETVVNLYRNARYLRVQLNRSDYLQLAEVEVMGAVTPVNGITLQNPGPQFSPRLTATSLQLLATATSAVTWSASGLPSGLTLTPSTGRIAGTPDTLGQQNVTITGTIAGGISQSQTFLWTVHPPGEVPGLVYRYYEGAWNVLPDFSVLTPVRSGNTPTFSTAPREREGNFALTFEGILRIPTTGTWTFYSNSDEGSQIWIDGRLVVNHDGLHTASEASGTITLPAGLHRIGVGYFQNTGAMAMAVSYAGPGTAKQSIPLAALYQPVPGVRYDYYEGAWSALPNFNALTPVKSGDVDNFTLDPRLRDDNFAMRYRATLRTPVAGTYTFYTSSDDGSKLFINGALIVNNDGLHATLEQQGTVTLPAGMHEIEVQYFEATGDQVLMVSYAGPGLPRQILGESVLGAPGVPGSPPVVTALASRSTLTGVAVSLPVIATDANNDPLTYAATGLPPGLGINATSGVISGTPTTSGNFSVNVVVSDGTGRSGSTAFTWNIVNGLTLAPLTATARPAGVAISYSAISTGGVNPRFRWNFGDGTGDTALSSSLTISKTFAQPGRYQVSVIASDDSGATLAQIFIQAVHAPLAVTPPTSSSPIAWQTRSAVNRVWTVNPDANTVSVFNAATNAKLAETTVGLQPVSVAIAPDGRAWVVNKKSGSISVINPDTFAVAAVIPLAGASRPHGLAFAPNGTAAFVALEGTGTLIKLNPSTGALTGTLATGPDVRHLSVSADSSKVYVSRFITPALPGESTAVVQSTVGAVNHGGQVLVVSSAAMTLTKTIILQHSERPDAENAGRGIPNYLGPAVFSPDGSAAWVPSKQDNIKRGVLRDTRQLGHDSTVRAIGSRIALASDLEDYASRIDFDDAAVPSHAVFDPTGLLLYVALEGSRQVAVVDTTSRTVLFKVDTGRAPQGLAVSPDGTRLFVQNFMDRTVRVLDLSALVNGGRPAASDIPTAATWTTVATEPLSAAVLTGKRFFYDARDPRISLQSYISCAACHNDGGHDGRTWDFTGMGEGLRNTTDLRGKAGVGQGPAHWTANFDEIQDFEKQIRDLGRGTGLMADTDFNAGTRNQPLGTPKAGLSADLDALAAYVSSLTTTVPSPNRNADGTMTAAAVAGREVFRTANCAECHSGAGFTNSAANNLRNIGTIKPSSGQRLGGTLTGLDTPTLRSIWSTAPYLHDGSAATLSAAVTAHQGVTLNPTDLNNLTAYLSQIDDAEATAPVPSGGGSGPGLRAEFFDGVTLGLNGGVQAAPLLTRTDASIDFDWASGAPAPGVPIDNFSIRWSGSLIADYSETYTVWVPADDGVRMWINNVLVLDKWDVVGWHNFTVPMTAGQAVPFKVEYKEGGGGANITVYWYSATVPWGAIGGTSYRTGTLANRAPVLTTPAAQSTVRGRAATLSVLASDPDFNPLTYSASGLPAGLSISPASGLISGTVGLAAAASNNVTLTVSDGALSASTSFAWSTTAPPTNRAPTLNNPGTQTSVRGSVIVLRPLAIDPDGDALTWSATGLPAGLALNTSTGQISGILASTAATAYTVSLTVQDPGGLTASATFTWNTTAPPLTGLRGEYYNGMEPGVGTPLLIRTDATIDFDWGGGSPSPAVPVDYFSARWTGSLTAPTTETYTIYAPSDNGVRIWINNQLVLDKWAPLDISGWHNFTINMTGGQTVPIKVEYAELYGGAGISLYWFSNTVPWEAIATSRLSPSLVLAPGSANGAVDMAQRTQRMIQSGSNAVFSFSRPSSSAGELAVLVQESADLKTWVASNRVAQVVQLANGTDNITINVPVAAGGSPKARYFRLRFVVPDPVIAP
jgi:YVTN family beta-propeller protein